MNVVGPAIAVAIGGEAVVQDPADVVAGVAADVVAEQEVGEQQVATVGEERLPGPEVHRGIEQRRVAADRGEDVDPTLDERPLVEVVGTRPDPQVPGVRSRLVAQEHRRQHRERGDRLAGPVTVDVRRTRAMGIRRDVERDLDVVEPVIEVQRGDELVGDGQGARFPQRGVGRREARRVAGTRSGGRPCRSGGGSVDSSSSISASAASSSAGGDDARHDEVAVGGEGTSLVDGQHGTRRYDGGAVDRRAVTT